MITWTLHYLFFFLSRFYFTDIDDSQDSRGKGGNHLLFHSTTSTHSRTLRHLFTTFHMRWLSRIFNSNVCVYQTATRWDLPPYRIAIWLIDWWCNVFCLLDELILGFCYNDFDMRNQWIWTRINYHPCITSEPTNQVY